MWLLTSNVAKWLCTALQAKGIFGEPPADRLSLCMAEITSHDMMSRDIVRPPDFNFHIVFTLPEVKALRKHEVIMYFTLDEVFIYGEEDYKW